MILKNAMKIYKKKNPTKMEGLVSILVGLVLVVCCWV